MESLQFIQYCLDSLNYWTITLLMAIESSFIPFPSEIVIPPAAYQAAATGEMNLLAIVAFATLGACIGALVNYILAMYLGRPVIYAFANSRWGHICLIDEQKVAIAESFFNRHGAISTLVGRLVPAVRQLISIPAGLAKMKIWHFLLYTALGSAVWNAVLAVCGYYLHSIVPKEQLNEVVMEYSLYFKWFFIIVAIVIALFIIYKSRK